MNLVISRSMDEDFRCAAEGHLFLGAASDEKGELHVFLRKDMKFAPEYYLQQQDSAADSGLSESTAKHITENTI